MFLFVSVFTRFVYDGSSSENAAASGAKLFVRIANAYWSLPFVTGCFVWDVVAVPDPTLFYIFSEQIKTIIMVCSEVSSSDQSTDLLVLYRDQSTDLL